MTFYDRDDELRSMEETRNFAFENYSRMTVMTGRRRIGKTALILKSCENTPTVYLFVNRGMEVDLCEKFTAIANNSLNTFVPQGITSFSVLFEALMNVGKTLRFNLIIDEFQEFFYINSSIYSLMQDIWDRYRKDTHVNLIISGSVYTLMSQIFQNYREPLYGRADKFLKLSPFNTGTLKQIIADFNPNYSNDDLLALYSFTGGVPKYIELLCDEKCLTMKKIVDFMIRRDSVFLNEGRMLLVQEFGKKYGSYFSILSAIASGRNTIAEMSALFDGTSLGGFLKRLEVDYEIIKKARPLQAKENSQTVRYEISDNFLRFWFRYFYRNQELIETGNLNELGNIIRNDYPTYSGLVLERYFKQKFAESMQFRSISSFWEAKGNQYEIDIVALRTEANKAVAVEVKRQKKNFKPEEFARKVEHLRNKLLSGYEIEQLCLTLEDM
jgi:AAA+ ATPase superfamily predicted ATPase